MFQNPIKHEWIRYVKISCAVAALVVYGNNNSCKTKGSSLSSLSNKAKIYLYMQNGFNEIRESSRCRMYKEIKQVHKPERYLTININKNLRTAFTKFRLSSHKLLVERGRWKSLKLDYELRKCTLCDSGDIEDEYHVTLICEQFVISTIGDSVWQNLLN